MIGSEHHSQLAERCTQLAIACSNPSLAGALDEGQPSAWEQPRELKIDPLGFGD